MIEFPKYRPEIDGLRAVAVIPVILFHAGFHPFSGGYVGVDVFFVISGYLITRIILSDLREGKFSLARFYERRARRILPALFFVMAVCIPFAWFILMPRDMKDFAQSMIAVSLFSSNILFYAESGYFAPSAELKPLLHTWSLAVEEQYYIVFPLLMFLIWRFSRTRVAAVFITIFVCSLLFATWSAYTRPEAGFYLLPGRAWELIIGAAIARFLDGPTALHSSRAATELLSGVGLAMIVAAVFVFDRRTPFPGFCALVPTLGAGLIILFAVPGTVVHRLLSSRYLVGIGLISYSAYLWHQPIFAFTKYSSSLEPGTPLMLFLCLASFALAYLSWRHVEQPFRNRATVGSRTIFLGSAVTAGILLSLGVAGHLANGFPSRVERNQLVTEGDIESADFNRYMAERYFRCTPEAVAAEALEEDGFLRCVQSRPSEAIDVAIVGDSHAEHLQIGIAEALPERNVVYYTRDSLPLIGNEDFRTIFSFVLTHEPLKVVILSMHYILRIEGSAEKEEFEAGLRATVEALHAAGKDVVLLADVPRFYYDPYRCMFRLKPFGRTKCDMVESVFHQEREEYEGILRAVGESGFAEYIDFSDLFCRGEFCHMNEGPVLQYRDNNHLNIPGSLKAGSVIVQRSAHLSQLAAATSASAGGPVAPRTLD